MPPSFFLSVCLDNVYLGDNPVEEVVGTLALHLANLRGVGRVGQDGVEELPHREVGGIDLRSETVIELALLAHIKPGR